MRAWIPFAMLVSLVPIAAWAESSAPSAAVQAAPKRAPAAASALASEGYTFMAEEKGVRVHRRENKRPGVEFAVEATLQATPDQVRRALLDYPNHTKWQKHLKENKVITRADDSIVIYQRLALPVVDDRDFTLRVTWGDDAGVLWQRFELAKDAGPKPVSGVVRVTGHEGSWRLEPDGKKTRAVYRFHFDAGGSIPSWLGKGMAQDDIVDFVKRLEKELPKYR